MPEEAQITDPPSGDSKTITEDPKKSDPSDIHSDIPERFKGKTAEEIAKSYTELEKIHGKHTDEVKKTRDELAQWEALGKVIAGNPELEKQVQEEIDRISGKKSQDKKEEPKNTVPDEYRRATESQIVNQFEKEIGLNKLEGDKKKEIYQRIGSELDFMAGPGGMKSIPLDRLPAYLDRAYKLATVNDREERSRLEAYAKARENMEASFGSIPSSGVNSETVTLTSDQQKAARKMGISEDNYKKQIKEIEKGV